MKKVGRLVNKINVIRVYDAGQMPEYAVAIDNYQDGHYRKYQAPKSVEIQKKPNNVYLKMSAIPKQRLKYRKKSNVILKAASNVNQAKSNTNKLDQSKHEMIVFEEYGCDFIVK